MWFLWYYFTALYKPQLEHCKEKETRLPSKTLAGNKENPIFAYHVNKARKCNQTATGHCSSRGFCS